MDKNKEVSKKYEEVWESDKEEIETINGKDFLKNSFESNDDFAMNKPRRLHLLTIIIRCVFSEGGKFYLQLFLDDALYELV